MNVATNKKTVIGQTVSDAALILAAVDPCYCCTERILVVDKESGMKLHNADSLIKMSHDKTERIRKGIFSMNK